MSSATSVDRHPPSDRWALRAVWLVLASTLAFAAWSYAVADWSAAEYFLVSQLLIWAEVFVTLTAFFAALLAALGAWPGRGPFWRSIFVSTILSAVPSSIVMADVDAHAFLNLGCCRAPTFWDYVASHSWPELVAYDVLAFALSIWVALLYFPAVRGWRLGVYLVISAAVLVALPITFPGHGH